MLKKSPLTLQYGVTEALHRDAEKPLHSGKKYGLKAKMVP
jgi:hypothetical protein